MLCKKCKKEIPDEAVYCCFCGIKQVQAPRNKRTRGNGTGSVFKLPNGQYKAVIQYNYRLDENGKLKRSQLVKRCKKKSDAILALDELRRKITSPDKLTDITVEEVHGLFLESQDYKQLSASQKQSMGIAWNKCKAIYNTPINILSVQQMQDVIDTNAKTYYPARDIKVLLSHLYKMAKKREILTYNKTENLELPTLQKRTKDSFNAREIDLFWNDYKNGNRFTGYILIMIYTGMRFGELSTINPKNILLQDRYLIGGIKSEAGRDRIIPFGSKLVPILTDLLQDSKADNFLPIGENLFYSRYWQTIERLGIRHLNPHCCRHTWFTLMASAGVQPALVATAGGHADINVAYKNYTHAQTKKLVEIAEKI